MGWLAGWALIFGPRPADEALLLLDEHTDAAPIEQQLQRAVLLAMLGRIDEASQMAESASAHLRDVTGGTDHDATYLALAAIAAGDRAVAVDQLLRACESWPPGSEGVLSAWATLLARDLCLLGRFNEAEDWLRRTSHAWHTPWARANGQSAEALLASHRGDPQQAESSARAAVAVAEQTDSLLLQARVYEDLGRVLASAGRRAQAEEALVKALDRYDGKKMRTPAEQVRARLNTLRAQASV
jgi:tetratricopeptide (TPR) repeat protein